MSSKQFFILIGTGIFCALLFAAPGLHELYKDIRDARLPISPPTEFITKTSDYGDKEIEVEWSLVLTREEPPEQSKTADKHAKKVYVAADVKNKKDKAIELKSLNFILRSGKAHLLNQSVISYTNPSPIKAKESTVLQFSIYITPDTLAGIVLGDVEITSTALFSEVPQ